MIQNKELQKNWNQFSIISISTFHPNANYYQTKKSNPNQSIQKWNKKWSNQIKIKTILLYTYAYTTLKNKQETKYNQISNGANLVTWNLQEKTNDASINM